MGLSGLSGLGGRAGLGGLLPGVIAAIDIPAMTGRSTPAPYVVSESSFVNERPGWLAFNQDNDSWVTSNGDVSSAHITIDLGDIYKISELTVWASNNDPSRMPTSWRLLGSLDGVSYTEFHVQSSYVIPGLLQPGPTITFTPVEYRHVRFEVNSVNGGFRSSVSRLAYK